jgi:hypothetical protein
MSSKVVVSSLALIAAGTLSVVSPAGGVTTFVGYVVGFPFTQEAKTLPRGK